MGEDFGLEYQFGRIKQVGVDISSHYFKNRVADQLDRHRLLDIFYDGIVQKLIGLHLGIESLKCPDSTAAEISQLKELINSAIQNAHILANKIAPHVLLKIGLRAALSDLLRAYADKCGICYYINVQNADLELLDETSDLVLYNLAKRLLDGVIYSCQANMVGISIKVMDAVVEMIFQDNGTLLSDYEEIMLTGQSREQTFLLEAAEEVCSLGGQFWIDKAIDMRTVYATIPLKLAELRE